MKKLLLLFAFLMIAVFAHHNSNAQTGCDGKSILFIGDNNTALGDSTIEEHLIDNLGFDVTYQNFADVIVDDLLTYDMVLVSSTISSGDAAALADVEIPVLCMESYSLDAELKMVEDPAEAGYSTFANVPYINDDENSFNKLYINQDDSTVAIGLDAGYAGDTVLVFTEDVPFGSNRHPGQWGVPNENAYLIMQFTQEALDRVLTSDLTVCGANGGDFCANPRYAAFAYPKGAEMAYDGSPAPDKRGFFFFHEYSAVVATQETWDIFNAMIYWFSGCLDTPNLTWIRSKVAGHSIDAKVYPNPAQGAVHIELNNENNHRYMIEAFNVLGKSVYNNEIKGVGSYKLPVHFNSPGFYLIRIEDEITGNTWMQKIVNK